MGCSTTVVAAAPLPHCAPLALRLILATKMVDSECFHLVIERAPGDPQPDCGSCDVPAFRSQRSLYVKPLNLS